MNYEIKNLYSDKIYIGGFSFLIGSFISYQIYKRIENRINKPIIEKKKNIGDPLDQVKECRRQGYIILINTMLEYNKKNKDGNFKDFMKEMWESDYEIIIKNENNDTSCKRDYSEWEHIFNLIKQN